MGDGSSDDTLPGKRSGSSSLPPADGPLWTGRKKKKKHFLSFLQYILVLLFFVCLPPQPSPPPTPHGHFVYYDSSEQNVPCKIKTTLLLVICHVVMRA